MKGLDSLLRLTFLLLLAVGVAAVFRLAPPGSAPLALVIIAVMLYGPLLLMGLFAARLQRRALTWLCFLLPFYFCGFVVQAFDASPARYWGLVECVLSVAVFTLALLRIRAARGTDA